MNIFLFSHFCVLLGVSNKYELLASSSIDGNFKDSINTLIASTSLSVSANSLFCHLYHSKIKVWSVIYLSIISFASLTFESSFAILLTSFDVWILFFLAFSYAFANVAFDT
ncbi:hypothetical protein [Mesoplasma melaleucae]|uniref:hypothetical protein n=1 Tax=Mesoplasma melaleucae TaxID=81459 RepID=UPI0004831605|nr:hypothetical protein [Mesoplasma melaleucae]